MKEWGTTNWVTPNTGATNSSGFAGLPGGIRNNTGDFNSIGDNGFWWSSTESNTTFAWPRYLFYMGSLAYRFVNLKATGYSVRCIKD